MPSALSSAMRRLPRIYWGVRPRLSQMLAQALLCQPSPTSPTTQRARRTFLPSSSARLHYVLRKFCRDSDDPGKKVCHKGAPVGAAT